MFALPITYTAYLALSIGMTIWVARTLHSNGRAFLVEAFRGNETLADSVNRLLVMGFYLINLGYVSLMLKTGVAPTSAGQAIEILSQKVGWVLLVLGAMHFGNIFIFSKMRRSGLMDRLAPPVPPAGNLHAEAK